MTLANHITKAEAWIDATARADSGAGGLAALCPTIANTIADAKSGTPRFTYQVMSSADKVNNIGVILYTEMQVLMKVTAQSYLEATIATAADRIDVLFGNVQNTAQTGFNVVHSSRLRPISTANVQDGVLWAAKGGIYIVLIELL